MFLPVTFFFYHLPFSLSSQSSLFRSWKNMINSLGSRASGEYSDCDITATVLWFLAKTTTHWKWTVAFSNSQIVSPKFWPFSRKRYITPEWYLLYDLLVKTLRTNSSYRNRQKLFLGSFEWNATSTRYCLKRFVPFINRWCRHRNFAKRLIQYWLYCVKINSVFNTKHDNNRSIIFLN